LRVPVLFPKLVSEHAAMYHELRKPGTRPAMRHGFAAGSFKTQADRSPAELG
jgi:hypothetical protein